jgi:hypothetical protein
MNLCQVGRNYDPNHPTCRTCQVGCPYNVIVISKTTGKRATLPEMAEQMPPLVEEQPPIGKKQTKTETEYGARLSFEFPGCKIRFEPIALTLENGHRYRPDWLVHLPCGGILLVEVKNGGFQHASYGRSKMAFNQARIDFPTFRYRWAEKCQGAWTVTDF